QVLAWVECRFPMRRLVVWNGRLSLKMSPLVGNSLFGTAEASPHLWLRQRPPIPSPALPSIERYVPYPLPLGLAYRYTPTTRCCLLAARTLPGGLPCPSPQPRGKKKVTYPLSLFRVSIPDRAIASYLTIRAQRVRVIGAS